MENPWRLLSTEASYVYEADQPAIAAFNAKTREDHRIPRLLSGKMPDMPPVRQTFQRAERLAKTGEWEGALVRFGMD